VGPARAKDLVFSGRHVDAEEALALGIADRVGSIAAGKDADLALFDGDPFEYTTRVTSVIINGQIVSEEAR